MNAEDLCERSKVFLSDFLILKMEHNKFQQLLLETFQLLYAKDERNLVWLDWKNKNYFNYVNLLSIRIILQNFVDNSLSYFNAKSFFETLIGLKKSKRELENQSIPTLEDPEKNAEILILKEKMNIYLFGCENIHFL